MLWTARVRESAALVVDSSVHDPNNAHLEGRAPVLVLPHLPGVNRPRFNGRAHRSLGRNGAERGGSGDERFMQRPSRSGGRHRPTV